MNQQAKEGQVCMGGKDEDGGGVVTMVIDKGWNYEGGVVDVSVAMLSAL